MPDEIAVPLAQRVETLESALADVFAILTRYEQFAQTVAPRLAQLDALATEIAMLKGQQGQAHNLALATRDAIAELTAAFHGAFPHAAHGASPKITPSPRLTFRTIHGGKAEPDGAA